MLFDSGASHSFIAASVVIELGLEAKALEEPLYVSSPLGIRVRIGMICRGCELETRGAIPNFCVGVRDPWRNPKFLCGCKRPRELSRISVWV